MQTALAERLLISLKKTERISHLALARRGGIRYNGADRSSPLYRPAIRG
jgi:hypothetical protein